MTQETAPRTPAPLVDLLPMIRRLRCMWRGHNEWTLKTGDGRMWAPACYDCGRPNSELRWAHAHSEVYARAPRPDEYPQPSTGDEWRWRP